ncbi:MAG: DsbC family protein [Candidatus Berkiella sp.]
MKKLNSPCKQIILSFVFLCAFFSSVLSFATEDEATRQNLVKILQSHFPDIKLEAIVATPIKEIYQVTYGPKVLYISTEGRFLFLGDIIDTQEKLKNITELARRQARIDALQQLKPEQSINFIPKTVKHTVTVFTDLDCGYCQKFHSNIKALNDKGIAVKYLAFPRGEPGSENYQKAISVWCAKNPNQALTAAKQQKEVQKTTCDKNPVDSEHELGILMGITGTPTLVLENGVMIPGYLPPEKLEELLARLNEI